MVTVVSPTISSRHLYHERLWTSFIMQTWEPKQLIVVDTGPAPSPWFSSLDDDRCTYLYTEGPENCISIGEKRNTAGNMAEGEYVASFDDDDMYAPCYLETMVRELEARKTTCIKLASWYNYDTVLGVVCHTDLTQPLPAPAEAKRKTMLYSYGFSLVHKKSLLSVVQYPHVSWAEDQGFLKLARFQGHEVGLVTDEEGLCIHLQHGGNMSKSIAQKRVSRDHLLKSESPIAPLLEAIGETLPEVESTDVSLAESGTYICGGSVLDKVDLEAEHVSDKLKHKLEQMEELQLLGWLSNPDAGVNEKRRELMAAPASSDGKQAGDAGDEHFTRCLIQYMKKKMKTKARKQAADRKEGGNQTTAMTTTTVMAACDAGEINAITEQLTLIYKQHNPDKLATVPDMMAKYKGQERKLLGKVLARYCPDQPAPPL
eukprot:TRINITY_DN24726_c0_g1_i1.p1 TRINITY_DN24726_c0_g1~~TRINITY_DN24726_c0_g1_i1.p1  ORF type:complete len:429 (-),score=114.63 TRINITY_DN24726_c0_g1_i1:476-1762(-)